LSFLYLNLLIACSGNRHTWRTMRLLFRTSIRSVLCSISIIASYCFCCLQIPEEEFWYHYLSFEGVEGMSSCVRYTCPKNSLKCVREGRCPPDGVSRRPKDSGFFEVDGLCDKCSVKRVEYFDGRPAAKDVVSCGLWLIESLLYVMFEKSILSLSMY
jgi:hypothetical protein